MAIHNDTTQPSDGAPPSHVVVALGSLGDILPLAFIAKLLQEKGHRVWFLAPGNFKYLALSYKLDFHEILTAQRAQSVLEDARLWQPRHNISVLWPAIFATCQHTVRLLEPLATQGVQPHLIGGTMALGVRVAHERWGWEHSTVQISPCWTFSAEAPPIFYGLAWLKYLPVTWRKNVWGWIERKLLDPICADEFNAWRAQFGLAKVRKLLTRWASSPQRIIGLYPPWFAQPQTDWPQQLKLSDFTLNEGGETWSMPKELDQFLGTEKKTVLVMAGSHMLHAARLFESMADVCSQLGMQALFIAPESIARQKWPAHVQVQGYAPLSQVLPRCAALVSHPGIGTIAQAMRSGTPMLLTPYAFDHHDNAQRAVALGVARQASPSARPAHLARQLAYLLHDPNITSACETLKTRMAAATPDEDKLYGLIQVSKAIDARFSK
jgi:rhamnosyltransferase subunit B